jgi:hypothetical protein
LYYYLFSEVEVLEFASGKLIVSSIGADKSQNSKIAAELFKWTSFQWNVIISEVQNPVTLKDKIRLKTLQSKEWLMLTTQFKEAELVDILLK